MIELIQGAAALFGPPLILVGLIFLIAYDCRDLELEPEGVQPAWL